MMVVTNISYDDVPPTWVTFEGKFTGGIVAAFTVSTIVVPGTWG
jgi:hypothetical protein